MDNKIKNRFKNTLLVSGILFLFLIPTGIFWNLARPVLHKDIINKYAAEYKMDPLFLMSLVKVESSFIKSARSPRGAIGLMQLMPDTAMEMGQRVGRDVSLDEVADPEINIHLGTHYISILKKEFSGDLVSLLAAYNAGPTNVKKWKADGLLTIDKIPFKETRLFVKKVIRTHKWLKRFQRIKNVFNA